MKKTFTKSVSVLKLSMLTGLVTGSLLLTSVSYGQVYYSRFPSSNTDGKYSVSNPTDCGAPAIQDASNIIDIERSNYATISGNNIPQRYNCGPDNVYKFDVDLNLPSDTPYLNPGAQAGFAVRIPPGFNNDSLGYYLKVSTFLRDSANPENVQFQEYAVAGGSSGLQLKFTIQDPWVIVYFDATKPFNLLQLDVDPAIITPNTNFEFGVYWGTGGKITGTYPAEIANFKAAVSGKNVSLSWQSLTETNVSSYHIERSNGGSYNTVATIPARGNSNAALSYGYTDNVAVDGSYLYRIVTVNKDGTSKATNSIAAAISGQGKLVIYPTIVKAGQNVTVRTSETGLVTVHIFDAQGRLVKQQRTTSTGQFSLSTSGLSSGVYNVKVVSPGGVVLQSKIVVN